MVIVVYNVSTRRDCRDDANRADNGEGGKRCYDDEDVDTGVQHEALQ